jgi:hypothetical protein
MFRQKNKCAVCALALLVQILMFCTIFRIMHNGFVYGSLREIREDFPP